MLDAMTGMGYLQKAKDQTHRRRGDAREFLVRGKPLYMGDLGQISKLLMMAWTALPDATRRGAAPRLGDRLTKWPSSLGALVPAIFTFNFIAAVSQIPPATRRQIKRILDVGAGAERTGPAVSLLFGLNMLINTPHGDVLQCASIGSGCVQQVLGKSVSSKFRPSLRSFVEGLIRSQIIERP